MTNLSTALRGGLPVAALMILGISPANAQTSTHPSLIVDAVYNNVPNSTSKSPYATGGKGTLYQFNNVTVGQISQGELDQLYKDTVLLDGQLTLGDGPGSNGQYYLGSSGTAGNATDFQVSSLVIGNGGQGSFTQQANTLAFVGTISFGVQIPSAADSYTLGGGTLYAVQVGQNSGTASGTFTFFGGTLVAYNSNATFMQGLSAAYVSGGATIDNNGYSITIAQPLLNSGFAIDGGLVAKGVGSLTLTGASTYTGSTAINGGILNAGNAAALGNGGTITFGGGTLQYSTASAGTDYSARFSSAGSQSISLDTNGQNVTLGSGISGGGTSLTKLGAGTLSVSGNNAYTGATAINAGVLNAGSTTALGNGGAVTFGGGTLQYSAASSGVDFSSRFSSAGNQAISLDTNGQSVTIGSGFGGSGTSLTKLGAGTLTVNGGDTYTGATNLNAGTVLINNQGALGSGTIVFGGGTLQYGDTSRTDAQYNTADFSSRFGTSGGQSYLINTGSHNITYGTGLTSGGGLTKSGTGTLSLNGADTYPGATNVQAGTLLLNNTNTGRGNVFVDGTTPVLGGTGSTTSAVTIRNGAINPGGNVGTAGASSTVGNLSVGSLTLDSHSTFTLDVNSATFYDVLTSGGNVQLGSSALVVNVNPNATFSNGQILTLIHLTGGSLSGTFTGVANNGTYTFGGDPFRAVYTSTDFELVAVPEPVTSWRGRWSWSLAARVSSNGGGCDGVGGRGENEEDRVSEGLVARWCVAGPGARVLEKGAKPCREGGKERGQGREEAT